MDQTLRNAVLERLDQLGWAAAEGNADTVLPAARSELCRLADSFRALLDEHQPDDSGRCRACPGTLRGRRWPCTVWVTVRRHLLGSPTQHIKEELRTEPAYSAPPAVPSDADSGATQPEGFAWFAHAPAAVKPDPASYWETHPTAIYRAPVVERPITLF
jgi:hypothetical protein